MFGNLSSIIADNYECVYYTVLNNGPEGLKFLISNNVDIHVNSGMLPNTSVDTAINTRSNQIIKWLLDNGANPKLLTEQSLRLADTFGSDELKQIIAEVS